MMEVDDIDFLSEEVSAARLQQKGILALVEEVKALRIQNEEKDKRRAGSSTPGLTTSLSLGYSLGLPFKNGEEPGDLEGSSTRQQVSAFTQTRGTELDCDKIVACHPPEINRLTS